jgi:hypothetical protein
MRKHLDFLVVITILCAALEARVLYDEIKAEPPFWYVFLYGNRPYEHHYLSLGIWTLIAVAVLSILWSRADVSDRVFNFFFESLYRPRVFAGRSTIVTFKYPDTKSVLSMLVSTPETDMERILTENPSADLLKHQDALGVEILDVQTKVKSPRVPQPPLI